MKRFIKHLVSLVAQVSGMLFALDYFRYLQSGRTRCTVLMYHRVAAGAWAGQGFGMPGMTTFDATFRSQLQRLSRAYRVLPLLEAVARQASGTLPFRAVAITFDDGWRDNYDVAWRALREFELPATIFVSTDFIETDDMPWFHVIYELVSRSRPDGATRRAIVEAAPGLSPADREALFRCLDEPRRLVLCLKDKNPAAVVHIAQRFREESGKDAEDLTGRTLMLSWDQMREMAALRVSFGSHGLSHSNLALLSPEDRRRELVESKNLLEKQLGMAVTSIAYPNGDFDEPVREAAQQAGYTCGCVVRPRTGGKRGRDPLALPRIGLHELASAGVFNRFSPVIFSALLSGLWKSRGKADY